VKSNKLFHLVSLGCPKNRVDSERILFVMSRAGYSHTDDPTRADAIVINTCAFIEPAVEESIDAVLDARHTNSTAALVVAGCLPQRFGADLVEPLPEVDLFLPLDRMVELPRFIEAALARRGQDRSRNGGRGMVPDGREDEAACKPQDPKTDCSRILSTPGYAYLKIAEGCSRRCRFCTIPSIRGPLSSADPVDLEREAGKLTSLGVRELVLVAQDLTAYGVDRGETGGLTGLLERLRHVKDIAWIRLMYLHPDGIPRDLPHVINESDNILPYLDIPFQHVSDNVLRAMGRPGKGDRIRKLVENLRREIPGLVLRSTFMIGFPGEGDKEFQELAQFVESFQLEHVGVFAYSPEEGTPAFHLGDPVPPEVKQARAEAIQYTHSRFMDKRNRNRVGRLERCLVEGLAQESDLLLQGRVWDQAPEIDGALLITAGRALQGEMRTVRITDSHASDLFGELIDTDSECPPDQYDT
jgi:ribosomal protein S12 methylthiotransferase